MKKLTYTAIILSILLLAVSCNFLDEDPQGFKDEKEIKKADQANSLVTAAYSALGNDHYDTPFSLWAYGNVRSDDAYKGGSDINDISAFHYYEINTDTQPNFGEADRFWFQCYEAISRCNTALSVLKKLSTDDYADKDVRMGEVYFLRGHFYFIMKTVFGHIPFVNEDLPVDDYDSVPNTLPNDEQWAWIVNDFTKAYELLPEKQPSVGRANKIAAAAYLAKIYLYKAYRQDERNNVTGIDDADLKKVLVYTQVAMNSSYGLEPDFAFNFLPGPYENGKEAIFSIQFSKDDGTKFGRLNFSDVLSLPQGLGCCDFHKPSQNLVNAFKTNNGLPMFKSYNQNNFNPMTDNADPRLFHTVAMDGFPFKYDETLIYKNSWNRNPNVYGYFASLKENVTPSCDCFVTMSPFYANTKNRIVLRYADVMLFRAEALIELGMQDQALPIINEIRERARKSTGLITYAQRINISTYSSQGWTQSYARQALRWERRLEMAMEGSRFFDLVRWGEADSVLNTFYKEESPRRDYYKNANFTKNKNEYIPIPSNQISFSGNRYKQNPGW